MFGYNAFCADQESQSCCWLYAPAIAQSLLPTQESFDLELNNLTTKLLADYTQDRINGMKKEGAPPEEFPKLAKAMGMKKVANLGDLIAENEDQYAIYWALEAILKKYGPVVLQHVTTGGLGSFHQVALIGVMTAILKDQDLDLYELDGENIVAPGQVATYIIVAHTQHCCYVALPAVWLAKLSKVAYKVPVPTDIYSVDRSSIPLSVIKLEPLNSLIGISLNFGEVVPLSNSTCCPF